MSVVSPARALWKKLVMSGEVEGRQSLSPHNAVVLEKGNLSLERGIPWRDVFSTENPQKEVSWQRKNLRLGRLPHAEAEVTPWRRLASG